MHSGIKNSCEKCLLPVLPEAQALGDTSLLFASLHCQCHKKKSEQSSPQKENAVNRCPSCGKQKASSQRVGSFTSYLFKDFRCQCRNSDKETSQSRGSDLQKNLSTQFFSASLNKTRMARLQQKMLGRTQMVLSRADSTAIEVLQPGEIIAGSYVLEEQVGQGGMGMIYRARHRHLGRLCALKFLLPSVVSAASWEMFKTEAKILNDLNHPAICHIYDMGLHKGSLPFYAMEYLDGITLEELLNRKNTLSLGATLEIFIAVGGALAYAHRQKIIHKDVKPANIMLVTTNNKSIEVKLLDFGIAELSDSGRNLTHSDIIGSASYMSPEQFTGEALSPATDIYSLACALFETLTGNAPFAGKSFQELSFQHQEIEAPSLKEATGQNFPPEIEAILAKALRKESHFRYKYMSEMVIDLERLAEGKELQFARPNSRDITDAGTNEGDEDFVASQSSISTKFRLSITLGLGILALAGCIYCYLNTVNKQKPQSSTLAAEKRALPFESTTEYLAETAEEVGKIPTNPMGRDPLRRSTHLATSDSNAIGNANSSRVIGGTMASENTAELLLDDQFSAADLISKGQAGIDYRIILPKETPERTHQYYKDQAGNILTKLADGEYGTSSDLDFANYVLATTTQATYSQKKAPLSLVIKENGKAWRIFFFPRNDSMGYLHDPDKTPLLDARSLVLMPEASPLYLLLNERYSPNIELGSRFDPQAFCKISLTHLDKLPDLTVLDRQKSLNTLILSDCLTSKNDFLSISKRKLIKRLILRDSHFAIGDLTNSGVLNTIEELHFKPDANQTIDNLLTFLAKKANSINTLSLEGEITPSSLVSLAQNKTLKTLALSEASLSDEHLELLAKLDNLNQIKIYYIGNKPLANFSDSAVNTLKSRIGRRLVLSNIPWS